MAVARITATEFAPRLKSLWQKIDRRPDGLAIPSIGLCISGGPDSMALAFLMKQIQREDKSRTFDLKAFIVNHGARDGSSDEAKTVAARLNKLGIESQVLAMDWPPGVQPSKETNFESNARYKRYRLLAQAAVQARITDLLTGHHEGDQIETILMRLLRSSTPQFSALQGMAEVSPIPCCDNILGARHGKARITRGNFVTVGEHSEQVSASPVNNLDGLIDFCSDGIELHRPLLSFPKSRLLRTCELHGVEYLIDKTNFEPQSTTRNAVRHLRCNYQLPRAISGQRILDLQRSSKEKMDFLRQNAILVLDTVRISSFDLRSGSMTVQLPKNSREFCQGNSLVVAYTLARLLQPVSPNASEKDPSVVRKKLVDSVFPPVGGRQVRQPQPLSASNESLVSLTPLAEDPGAAFTMWRLSRQPLRAREVKDLESQFVPDGDTGFSKWLFWDKRYWIRIQCLTANHVTEFMARPYTKADVINVHEQFYVSGDRRETNNFRWFKEVLNDAAPGNIRYTMPVLADQRQVLVFPTLNIAVPNGTSTAGPSHTSFLRGWEVRYKSINREMRQSTCFLQKPEDGLTITSRHSYINSS